MMIDGLKKPSEVWSEQIESGESFIGTPVAWWSGGLVLAGLSLGLVPELVIQVKSLELAPRKTTPSSLSVHGLEAFYELLNVDGPVPCLVLRPKQASYQEVFFSLADQIVMHLQGEDEHDGRAETLEKLLKQWMDFWSKEVSSVSVEQILGLTGELLAITRWLNLDGQSHLFWTGPMSLPQDFSGLKDALEVKVIGRRTGPRVHRISSTLQLQDLPEHGKLHVLSFRISLSPAGSDSIHDLVAAVRSLDMFKEAEGRAFFEDAIRRAGYSSELPLNISRFDLVEESLYEVRPGFPRIIRDTLPPDSRVLDVEYAVDFSACDEFKISDQPIKLALN